MGFKVSSSDKNILDVVTAAAKEWRKAGPDAYATDQSRKIFQDILPSVLDRFIVKNADYGDTASFLGAKGQFADINPKFWKLKKSLWDGETLHGESLEEILADLIGHCLLTLYFLDTRSEGDEAKEALQELRREAGVRNTRGKDVRKTGNDPSDSLF